MELCLLGILMALFALKEAYGGNALYELRLKRSKMGVIGG